MVKVIVGLKGSGKTKQLIDSINSAIKNESGSMVCIEKGSALTFDIDYRVRLIDASEYSIGTYTFLKGFISGLHAGNFDISHIGWSVQAVRLQGQRRDRRVPGLVRRVWQGQ